MILRLSSFWVLFATANPSLVTAFVLPSTSYCHARGRGFQTGNGVRGNTPSLTELSSAATDLPDALPPWDGTATVVGRVRELLAAPEGTDASKQYDGIGRDTFGTWQSNIFGLMPSTVVAAPLSTNWILNEEAAGNVVAEWLPSIVELLGPKAVSNMGAEPEAHARVRKMYYEALSPKAVLEFKPIVEDSLEKRVLLWKKVAASGEEIEMMDEINTFTLEIISRCFLGEYATGDVLDNITRLIPALSNGMVSIPRRLPWPLNVLPAFSFGRAVDARKRFRECFNGILQEHRVTLAQPSGAVGGVRRAGLLDSLLELQKRQTHSGGAKDGELVLNDDFIFDNVVNALFAGYDTTSATLARVIQLLGHAENDEVFNHLVRELKDNATPGKTLNKLERGTTGNAWKAASGIFENFPVLEAVVLEAFRLYPVANGVFRKAVKNVQYNGYLIPAGSSIYWDLLAGFRAKSLYPEPERFCPFRFLGGSKTGKEVFALPPTSEAVPAEKEQPRPPMFGFGKHMCPGRELSKLEIVLFLTTFLSTFEYDLVEGQRFEGVLPVNAPKDKLKLVLRTKATG